MIGYYVHHHGKGHLHRATGLARVLHARGVEVTGLSSLPAPEAWPGPWVRLDRDDEGSQALDVSAGGRLHWVPRHDGGLRRRSAQVSRWIEEAVPDRVVVDVSVEVALLARLHGVPVTGVVLPGRRGDAAHLLGLDVCDQLVGFWPAVATGAPGGPGMLRDVPDTVLERLHAVGGLSRLTAPPAAEAPERRTPGRERSVVVLLGAGGDTVGADVLDLARAQTPGWRWTVLGGAHGAWVPDPTALLAEAEVVVTHAGQNAVAEVATLRRPAVVVPQDRPHDEQRCTGEALAAGPWPVVVEPHLPADGWAARLEAVAALDGEGWAGWCPTDTAERFADLVTGAPA
ncbi:glycosyltransferase [Nocardioides sp. Leaf285]|uniref:glycosyltransferase n=1 Tax=Nocardioides sp. Leaf285 TaxID=1736322 RepID=UPI0007026A48|nr:glycosyltransferase [Nocardioides sp. Leaf285]KQP65258.1 hypothetical protein ASF47_05350 [Nocardioides sp. Leaf285]